MTASSTWILENVKLFLESKICTPVLFRISSASSTVMEELACLSNAHAPVTWGAAIEVPLKVSNDSPGTDDSMLTPGARRSRKGAEFEKLTTASAFVVAPTLIALEIHAGEPMESSKPSFPDEKMVAIPTERSESMMGLWGSLSQTEKNCPPPRLKFTEDTSIELLRLKTCSRSSIISESKALAHGVGKGLQALTPSICENT